MVAPGHHVAGAPHPGGGRAGPVHHDAGVQAGGDRGGVQRDGEANPRQGATEGHRGGERSHSCHRYCHLNIPTRRNILLPSLNATSESFIEGLQERCTISLPLENFGKWTAIRFSL